MARLTRCRFLLVALFASASVPLQAASVTIAWDPNPEPNVRYVVSWGTQHLVYTSTATSGPSTSYIVSQLTPGQTYYFAVQATTGDGLTSPYSEEVSATIPATAVHVATITSSASGGATTGSAVTWSVSATGGSDPLYYKFLLYSQKTDSWTVLQDYLPNSTLSWTPAEPGTYALQVWVRGARSTATYDDWRGTGAFVVESPALHISRVDAHPMAPVRPGESIVFTAVASGGIGPLQYQFWLLDHSTGSWMALGDYSTQRQVEWTAGGVGNYTAQVWVREAGSDNRFDAWWGNVPVRVTDKPEVQSLTSNVAGPVSVGTPVTWTAVAGGAVSLEYAFWRRHVEQDQWAVLQNYAPPSSVVWTPTYPGTYTFQVWAREPGANQPYQAWKAAGPYQVTAVDPGFTLNSVSADKSSPVLVGSPVTFEAHARAGSTPLEYAFWLYDFQGKKWRLFRDYGASPTAVWTPMEAGDYATQVWARRAGTSASNEAWTQGPSLTVAGTSVTIASLTTTALLPAQVGTAIPWTVSASAADGSALEYAFWVQDTGTGAWTLLQPWSAPSSLTWVPSKPGTYSFQAWARTIGSSASYEAWTMVSGVVIQ